MRPIKQLQLFILLLSSHLAAAQIDVFPDQHLRQWCRWQDIIDRETGVLNRNRMDELRTICLDHNRVSGIKDLTGIQHFQNVRGLNCSHSGIEKLPELPPQLAFLDCSGNQLKTLPELPASLEYLICSDNPIMELPPLPEGMVYISCANTRIHDTIVPPPKLVYFNGYQSNVIVLDDSSKRIDARHIHGNCMPPHQLKLFHIGHQRLLENYRTIKVSFDSKFAWGFGYEKRSATYKLNRKNEFVSSWLRYEKGKDQHQRFPNFKYQYGKHQFSFDQVDRILKDIAAAKLNLPLSELNGFENEHDTLRLSAFFDERGHGGCFDCSRYQMEIRFLNKQKEELKLSHSFFASEYSLFDFFEQDLDKPCSMYPFRIDALSMAEFIYLYQLKDIFRPLSDASIFTNGFSKAFMEEFVKQYRSASPVYWR